MIIRANAIIWLLASEANKSSSLEHSFSAQCSSVFVSGTLHVTSILTLETTFRFQQLISYSSHHIHSRKWWQTFNANDSRSYQNQL